ncbi:thiamine phosphate synthase [Algivirga pacifica]|uniref:Thiamine-phosphate synthase n=1 Tax=Algivirga pacifica TaxID=1162670 RepID=A0ABP9DKW4_9BACT
MNPLQFITQKQDDLTPQDQAALACQGGARWIQVRVKNEPEEVVRAIAESVQEICQACGAKLIINDYPEIAAAIGADGVHLGKEDIHPSEARKILGKDAIIGGTANTMEDILRIKDDVDYIGLGPLRFTETKDNLSPVLGLEGYKKILSEMKEQGIDIPVYAIGGIRMEDINPLLFAGVAGIAVSSLISRADDPMTTTDRINAILERRHLNRPTIC